MNFALLAQTSLRRRVEDSWAENCGIVECGDGEEDDAFHDQGRIKRAEYIVLFMIVENKEQRYDGMRDVVGGTVSTHWTNVVQGMFSWLTAVFLL